MPILPENRHRYPGGSPQSREWKAIVEQIRARSSGASARVGGSAYSPSAGLPTASRIRMTGSRVVLTVAHLEPLFRQKYSQAHRWLKGLPPHARGAASG